MMKEQKLILKLNDVGLNDIAIAGRKNAYLGEMIKNLSHRGIRVPGGFLLTVASYYEFINYNNLEDHVEELAAKAYAADMKALKLCGNNLRKKIEEGEFSPQFKDQIQEAYNVLSLLHRTKDVDVAVRCSAIEEGLPDAFFASGQETFLNICGIDQLLNAIKKCYASLFTDRAISYRQSFGDQGLESGLSVCVQKMVRSDLGASGVAFSLDTESGFEDVVIINGAFGLGEMVVQGAVSPDEFITYKPLLAKGFPAILEKKFGNKDKKMIYSQDAYRRVEIADTNEEEKRTFCLSDKQIIELSKNVIEIENYYTQLKGYPCPVDVEWALDGQTNQLFIVQARQHAIHFRKDRDDMVSYKISELEDRKLLFKGIAIGDKIGAGEVKIVPALTDDLSKIDFKKGDVLVTAMTDLDWEPIMKIASAIITEMGGRTCHAAIVARKLGIPAIVGCTNAIRILEAGDLVTVSCAEGDVGMVYRELLSIEKSEISLSSLPKTITPILLNVASPDKAFQFAHLPHGGIGLAGIEFIINNYIKVHPLALINSISDAELRAKIDEITVGYCNGEEYFIEKLSNGLAKIAASCYPKQVIVRFSDFKSNEYANLLGGKCFEPEEENPMIGFRGASRYYSDSYKKAFGLECKAIKNVREKLGLDNITVMIPFCRTVGELLKVYEVMEENGLKRKQNGLQVYLMAELPSNFILATEFADHVDGFSIGSNDLTQLVLGLDRDSEQVAHLYDERNAAVKKMITMLIDAVQDKKIKLGICGSGPSDFPDFVQFLVDAGVDTISVTPDAFAKTLTTVAGLEGKHTKRVFKMWHRHSFI